ncbi:hypothetical protein U1Q18_007361 [Sarracenia purpurea var. burkii]
MADLCLSIHGRDRTGCDVVVPSTICRWFPLVLGDPRPVVPYQFTPLRRACSLSTSFHRSVATELWKDQIWNRNDPALVAADLWFGSRRRPSDQPSPISVFVIWNWFDL